MHIQVELKFLEVNAPGIARAVGVPIDRVIAGAVLLWHRCWSVGADTVTTGQLAGCFGGDRVVELAAALVDHGLLEELGEGFRVRGAGRYLRLKKSLSEGARKTNAARWQKTDSDETATQVVALERPETSPLSPTHRRTDAPTHRRTDLKDLELPLEPAAPVAEVAEMRTRSRKASEWELVWATLAELRREKLAEVGDADDQELAISRINQLLKRAAEHLQKIDPVEGRSLEDRGLDLVGLWKRYLWSQYWRDADPPFPLEGFCSPKTISKLNALMGGPTDPVKTGEWFQ